MTYTCLCCGYSESFDDANVALTVGWDVAPDFTVQPLCPLCPASPVVVLGLDGARARHADSHTTWTQEGRPAEFDIWKELNIDKRLKNQGSNK